MCVLRASRGTQVVTHESDRCLKANAHKKLHYLTPITHTHTYTHTYIHTHIHTYTHTYTHIYKITLQTDNCDLAEQKHHHDVVPGLACDHWTARQDPAQLHAARAHQVSTRLLLWPTQTHLHLHTHHTLYIHTHLQINILHTHTYIHTYTHA